MSIMPLVQGVAYNLKQVNKKEKHIKKQRNVPKAQMTCLALFGPILVIIAHPNAPNAFEMYS